MPSGHPLGYDLPLDHLWSRVVDLVQTHQLPDRQATVVDRDLDSMTWLLPGPNDTETHVTVRERPSMDLPFQRTHGRTGVWADLVALRVGLSMLVGFTADPAIPGPWPELTARPGQPSISISVTDDVGSWYNTVNSWAREDIDFGLRFTAPPREASLLTIQVEDRGVLLAQYTAALPTPLTAAADVAVGVDPDPTDDGHHRPRECLNPRAPDAEHQSDEGEAEDVDDS